MNKLIAILFSIVFSQTSFGQREEAVFNEESFDRDFFSYQAIQREGVSDKNFRFAEMILSETKKALNDNVENYNIAHYWNIATAFSTLNESKENISIVFKKAVKSDGVCEYFESFKKVKNHFSRHIPDLYKREEKKCLGKITSTNTFDLSQYSSENNLDLKLVRLFQQMDLDDKKFRDLDFEKNKLNQKKLDLKNQKILDSLYQYHKTYIGVSKVGDLYKNVMWAVIQHSNLEMMEKYLPIFQKAFEAQDLTKSQLKMLIDRVYWLREGYQIFGSQQGVRIADKEIQLKIIKKYHLEE